MIISFKKTNKLAEDCAKVALVVLLVDCCAAADKQQVLRASRSEQVAAATTQVYERPASPAQEETSEAQEEIRRQQELRPQQQPLQPPQAVNPAEGSFLPDSDEYLIGVGLSDITGPSADINLVSLIRQLVLRPTQLAAGSTGGGASGGGGEAGGEAASVISFADNYISLFSDILRIWHPGLRELSDVKLQLKINIDPLFLRTPPLMNTFLRWAMPNQIRMQAEYTYVNLVVQL